MQSNLIKEVQDNVCKYSIIIILNFQYLIFNLHSFLFQRKK